MGDIEFEIPDDAGEHDLDLPATLPILALKDTVVFPQSMMPLAIGQERSIRLIDDVVAGDRFLALVAARDTSIDSPDFDDIYDVYERNRDVFRQPYASTVDDLFDMHHFWDDILAALEKVAHGETFVSSSMSRMGQRRSDRVQELLLSKPQIDDLTSAERRILKLIAEDRTSKEIADLLQISIKTVENHRLNICRKLNLHGSHSLLKFAFDNKSYL